MGVQSNQRKVVGVEGEGAVMNEVEMKAAVARAEGSRIAYEWMKRNLNRYAACEANSKLIEEWLVANNLPLSGENLDKAAEAIGDRLAHAPITAPPTPAPPSEPTLDDVAPVPHWFPPMNSKADLAAIGNEKMKQLMYGPAKEAFKRRLDAIQNGVKPAPRPTAVPQAVAQAVTHDDGLPPAPAGLDWSMFQSVQQINDMSRESFRVLYHSKAYGEAFRRRVDAIYRRAKEGRQ
jgi:hypothetical protein